MSIEEIPSNELIEMTQLFHRAFNAAGCNPACHCCYKFISVGKKFKLATVREVKANMDTTANATAGAFQQDVVDVITGKLKESNHVKDETKEVMLCEVCTSESFKENQLKNAKKYAASYKKYRENGGGCFRINGKIVH